MEGGFRVPCILRWPGHVPADSVQNGIFSGMDWFPTFLDAAGNPNITDQLLNRRLRPDGRYHRQRPVHASRNLLPRRKQRRRLCGSSFAAPHGAALLARILSVYPDLAPLQAKSLLHQLAKPWSEQFAETSVR